LKITYVNGDEEVMRNAIGKSVIILSIYVRNLTALTNKNEGSAYLQNYPLPIGRFGRNVRDPIQKLSRSVVIRKVGPFALKLRMLHLLVSSFPTRYRPKKSDQKTTISEKSRLAPHRFWLVPGVAVNGPPRSRQRLRDYSNHFMV
jgi:hypothetical protein